MRWRSAARPSEHIDRVDAGVGLVTPEQDGHKAAAAGNGIYDRARTGSAWAELDHRRNRLGHRPPNSDGVGVGLVLPGVHEHLRDDQPPAVGLLLQDVERVVVAGRGSCRRQRGPARGPADGSRCSLPASAMSCGGDCGEAGCAAAATVSAATVGQPPARWAATSLIHPPLHGYEGETAKRPIPSLPNSTKAAPTRSTSSGAQSSISVIRHVPTTLIAHPPGRGSAHVLELAGRHRGTTPRRAR